MTREEGRIVKIDDKGWAEVVTQRRDTCGGCNAGHRCTAFVGSSKMLIKAANRVGAGEGDLVSIDLVSRGVIQTAAILYIIPVLGLILGAVLGSALELGRSEATPLFTLLGLIIGFLVTILISRHLSKKEEFTPVITGILKSGARNSHSFVVRDPVCKALLDPEQAPTSLTYHEKVYHFCDFRCRDTFIKHPEEYV
jgi:sigma-E factor negative regulatory protein RseC